MTSTKERRIEINSASLEREFEWFEACVEARFKIYFNAEKDRAKWPPAPNLENDESDYARIAHKFNFNESERLMLCLAMAPHLKPQLLDLFFTNNAQLNQPFTEFGGYTGKDHKGFLPTGETAAFLLSNGHIDTRVEVWELLSPGHSLVDDQIIYLDRKDEEEPLLSGRLLINPEYLYLLTMGTNDLAVPRDRFPAKRMTTQIDWQDFVVSPSVRRELSHIETWIEHGNQLRNDAVFRKHVKPGFRSLFYGPPGTGKRTAASLLGKTSAHEVYRVDLSLIISKFIGETEKNLSRVFTRAERKNWILFFDEADALFGKRTEVNSSSDRFINQEVGYLLQRIEDFEGVVIFAASQKPNIDEAFSRRLHSTIHFPMPDPRQRLRLWQNIFSGEIKPEASVNLQQLADKYELSGGSIANVFRSSALSAMRSGKTEVSLSDILSGIRAEFQKNGKLR